MTDEDEPYIVKSSKNKTYGKKLKIAVSVTGIALYLVVQPVMAGQIEDAEVAINAFDYETAVRLLKPLVEQGNAKAENLLGSLYDAGHGLPRNRAEGLKLTLMAAEQSDPMALLNLGATYDIGSFVPRDYVKAYMWYNLAAALPESGVSRYAASSRDELEKKMSGEQVAKAQQLSTDWLNAHPKP